MVVVLIGDVGGTRSRLRLVNLEQLIKEGELPSQGFPSFSALVGAFLKDQPTPQVAALGIAGPVAQNRCKITNVDWVEINGDQIAHEFGLEKFVLLNDFEAAGYGVLDLRDEDLININRAAAVPGRPKAVIGAGTGIGECILTAHNGEYVVWPGEGGHSDFFPKFDVEASYARYILYQCHRSLVNLSDSPYKQFKPIDNITVELAIGGIVLHHLYYFFRSQHPYLVNPEFDAAFEASYVSAEQDGRAKLLFEWGLSGRDVLAQMGVHLFLSILGYEAGNIAAKTLPYGGLYIMGGVVQNNLDAIVTDRTLTNAFYKKPPHVTKILEQVPVYLVKRSEVGLLGAKHYARQLISHV